MLVYQRVYILYIHRRGPQTLNFGCCCHKQDQGNTGFDHLMKVCWVLILFDHPCTAAGKLLQRVCRPCSRMYLISEMVPFLEVSIPGCLLHRGKRAHLSLLLLFPSNFLRMQPNALAWLVAGWWFSREKSGFGFLW